MGTPEDVAAEEYFTRPIDRQLPKLEVYMAGEARKVKWGLIDEDAPLPEVPAFYDLIMEIPMKESIGVQLQSAYLMGRNSLLAAGWCKVVKGD